MFIELVILACLHGGEECREFQQLYDPRDVSLITCMAAAQPQLALWQDMHAPWQIVRWRCGVTDPSARSV